MYETNEEAKKKWKQDKTKQGANPEELEEEIDLETYWKEIEPCLKTAEG